MGLDNRKKPWKQRKVLELLLVGRTLQQLSNRYKSIMDRPSQKMEELFYAPSQKEGTANEEEANDREKAKNREDANMKANTNSERRSKRNEIRTRERAQKRTERPTGA